MILEKFINEFTPLLSSTSNAQHTVDYVILLFLIVLTDGLPFGGIGSSGGMGTYHGIFL